MIRLEEWNEVGVHEERLIAIARLFENSHGVSFKYGNSME